MTKRRIHMTYRISSLAKAMAGLAIFAVSLLGTGTHAVAQQEKVLHSFNDDGIDGIYPTGSLITPYGNGVLYGTTYGGGADNLGTVFLVDTKSGAETVLTNVRLDIPHGSLTCCGSNGNLFGTTLAGGHRGAGTVFEVLPTKTGGVETVLYRFKHDGLLPYGDLALGPSIGNHFALYGTTNAGGAYGGGTVFEVLHEGGLIWKVTGLYSFHADSLTDGSFPFGGVTIDAAGNLYGTTDGGGTYGSGTVFELSPTAGGSWVEKVLHAFESNGTDGGLPTGGLILDAAGNLYGTTASGGAYNSGTVFELTPAGEGNWTETVLHNFNDDGMDGFGPRASLIFDTAGNLYGTTILGGTYGYGTVFELTPAGGGIWTETLLHSFAGSPDDGANPVAGLVIGTSGILYGTTNVGGTYHYGTVFQIEP
jgi:uncharacterized repeat protein (TIGR03803 family)